MAAVDSCFMFVWDVYVMLVDVLTPKEEKYLLLTYLSSKDPEDLISIVHSKVVALLHFMCQILYLEVYVYISENS